MSNRNSAAEELAEKNMRRWLLAEHTTPRRKPPHHDETIGPYVTISREVGAGGSEIARGVGRELGWEVLDREIVDIMANEYGLPHQAAELMDEKHPTWIEDWFACWFNGYDYSASAYLHWLKRILLLAGQHGQVVIVGRGAQFVLPKEGGISVRILAPREFRIDQVVTRKGLSARKAAAYIDENDRRHQDFAKEFLNHDATDPHMYDIVLNIEKLTVADAVSHIVDAAKVWMAQSEKWRGERVAC